MDTVIMLIARNSFYQVINIINFVILIFLPSSKMISLNSPISHNYSANHLISSATSPLIPSLEPPFTSYQNHTTTTRRKNDKDVVHPALSDGNVLVDYLITLQSSCFHLVTCQHFDQLSPPPDFMDVVPPPPLPMLLFEMDFQDQVTQEFYDFRKGIKDIDVGSYYAMKEGADGTVNEVLLGINPKWLTIDKESGCHLCQWAQSNSSEPLFRTEKTYSAKNKLHNWMEHLTIVGLISLFLGAALATIIIKLINIRRRKNEEGRGTGEDLSSREPELSSCNQDEDAGRIYNLGTPELICNNGCTNCPRNSLDMAQPALSPQCSSSCSRPIDEELYLNLNTSAVAYYELKSKVGSQHLSENYAKNSPAHHIYYDISNYSVNSSGPSNIRTLADQIKSRGVRTPEEIFPNNFYSEISSGTSSNPSSAYYSDLSNYELTWNRRPKIKFPDATATEEITVNGQISGVNSDPRYLSIPSNNAGGQEDIKTAQYNLHYPYEENLVSQSNFHHSRYLQYLSQKEHFENLLKSSQNAIRLYHTNSVNLRCKPNISSCSVIRSGLTRKKAENDDHLFDRNSVSFTAQEPKVTASLIRSNSLNHSNVLSQHCGNIDFCHVKSPENYHKYCHHSKPYNTGPSSKPHHQCPNSNPQTCQ